MITAWNEQPSARKARMVRCPSPSYARHDWRPDSIGDVSFELANEIVHWNALDKALRSHVAKLRRFDVLAMVQGPTDRDVQAKRLTTDDAARAFDRIIDRTAFTCRSKRARRAHPLTR